MMHTSYFGKMWSSKLKNLKFRTLSKKVKSAMSLEIGSTTTTAFIITPEDHYRIIYFEAFDIVVAQITDRFENHFTIKNISIGLLRL